MTNILVFAGTTEGRLISDRLAESEINNTICVATKYGEEVLDKNPYTIIHSGRMDEEEIKDFIKKGAFNAVVDATHPYAKEATKNIKAAADELKIPYFRFKRKDNEKLSKNEIKYFADCRLCGEYLDSVNGNVLLTIGSKELADILVSDKLKSRVYARVLPLMDSISLCEKAGIKGKQVIALQGPFTKETNEALIKQYDIKYLVTKETGTAGGFNEKIEAALDTDTKILIIGKPEEKEGLSFKEVCEGLSEICKKEINSKPKLNISLAGIGMGDMGNLTRECYEQIEKADILLGAKRMIEAFSFVAQREEIYSPDKIMEYLSGLGADESNSEGKNIVVLFSGDSGFYSGCLKLYQVLKEEIKKGNIYGDVKVFPGISSFSYFAARLGESYHDAEILSIHGRKLYNLANRIKYSKKTFLLLSGLDDVKKLGESLDNAGISNAEISLGYKLSYPDEEIIKLKAKDVKNLTNDGLYIAFIKNEDAKSRLASHGLSDGEFLRDKVPMTKEEVREVSISKLRLTKDSTVYDIGSGSGSIAIEMAALSDEIKVYAIERKPEAVKLIGENKRKFNLENIEIIEAYAPESLENLPKASHAFIGGSGGNLKDILEKLKEINPAMRVVANAISLETIYEFKEVLSEFEIVDEELVQMQVSRAKKLGNYNLMQAENPVWILAFNFKGD